MHLAVLDFMHLVLAFSSFSFFISCFSISIYFINLYISLFLELQVKLKENEACCICIFYLD